MKKAKNKRKSWQIELPGGLKHLMKKPDLLPVFPKEWKVVGIINPVVIINSYIVLCP